MFEEVCMKAVVYFFAFVLCIVLFVTALGPSGEGQDTLGR